MLGRRIAAIATGCLCLGLAAGAPARARAPLSFAVQDDPLFLGGVQPLADAVTQARELGFDTVRLSAHWNDLAPRPRSARRPRFDARNPAAYPQARWAALDAAVRQARAAGLSVMIDVAFFAPRWATRGTPASDPRPRNLISPTDFSNFAAAIARRYSGAFRRSRGAAPLPRVNVFTLWNEPNLAVFYMPQRTVGPGGKVSLASPHSYRRMASAAYGAIKAYRPDSTVLVGALAAGPAWQPNARQAGIPALRFLREMACVDSALRPLHTRPCRGFRRVPGDGLSVHPYGLGHAPDYRPTGDRVDTVTMGNLGRLTALTRALVARGRIAPAMRDLYLTEFGYLTGVPGSGTRALRNPFSKVSLSQQASYLTWAHYLAWRQPQVKLFSQFLLRDTLCASFVARPCIDWPSGLFFHGGARKPAAAAAQAGLFVRRLAGGDLFVWVRLGSAQARASASLQYRANGSRRWRAVPAGSVRDYRVDASNGSAAGGPAGVGDGIATARLTGLPAAALRVVFDTPNGPRAGTAARPRG